MLRACLRITGQVIASLQLVAIQSTNLFAYHRGAAPKAGWYIKTACYRQINTGSTGCVARFDSVTLIGRVGLPLSDSFTIDFDRHLRTCDDDSGVYLRLE